MQRNVLHVVCQSHLDPVWLWPLLDGEAETLCTIQSAVDRCAEVPQFTFTRSSAAAYRMVEETDPCLFAELKRLVAKGRWEPVGWVEQPDCNIPSTESLVRQALHAQRYYARTFGFRAHVGWNPDSFGHSACLPQILRRTGYDCYVFGRPTPDEAPWLPMLFWWQGADGSRVLALRPSAGFCQSPAMTADDLEQHIRGSLHRFFPDGIGHGIAFVGIGNHGGALSRAHVARLVAMQQDDSLPELRFSTPSAYFAAVQASVKPSAIPVHEGELGFCLRGTYAATGDVKRANRTAERALFAAGSATSAAHRWNATASGIHALDEAWWRLLSCQFHDVLAGTCTAQTHDETCARFGSVIDTARAETSRAVLSMARRVDTRKEPGSLMFVFNPLPWPRRALVQLDTFPSPHGEPAFARIESKRGTPSPIQWMQADAPFGPHLLPWGKLTAIVDMPPCGYKVFRLAAGDTPPVAPATSIGAAPAIAGFLSGPISLVVMRDDHDTWGYRLDGFNDEAGRPELVSSRIIESGPLCCIAEHAYRWQNSTIIVQCIAVVGSEFMDIAVRGQWNERRQVLKLEVPTELARTMVLCEAAGGIVPRTASGNEEPFVHWVALEGDLKDQRHTLCLMCDGAGAFDARGGKLRVTLLRAAPYAEHPPVHVPDDPSARYLDQGTFERRFRIMFASGPAQEHHLPRAAAEFLTPCIAVLDSAHPGDAPWERSLLAVAPSNIMVSSVSPAQQGGGIVVRVQETAGRPTRVRLTHSGTTATSPLAPWELKTFEVPAGGKATSARAAHEDE